MSPDHLTWYTPGLALAIWLSGSAGILAASAVDRFRHVLQRRRAMKQALAAELARIDQDTTHALHQLTLHYDRSVAELRRSHRRGRS